MSLFNWPLTIEDVERHEEKISSAVENTDAYFTRLSELIDKNCFKQGNEDAVNGAVLSMTSIAGLFMSNPVGEIVTLGSKLLQKVINLGINIGRGAKKNKIKNITNGPELFDGLRCAVQDASEKQCKLFTKNKLFEEVSKLSKSKCSGIADLYSMKNMLEDSISALSAFNTKITEKMGKDQTSLTNIAVLASWDSRAASLDASLYGAKSNLDADNLKESEPIYQKVHLNRYASSNSNFLQSYAGSIFHPNIDLNEPRLSLKLFLGLIYGEGATEAKYNALETAFIEFKRKQTQGQQTFDPDKYKGRSSDEMYQQMFSEYWDDRGYFKAGVPAQVTEIFESLKNPDLRSTVKSNLKTYSSKYKQYLKVESGVLNEETKQYDFNSFAAHNGSLIQSPLESLDKMTEVADEIVANRELLKRNMEKKIVMIGKQYASSTNNDEKKTLLRRMNTLRDDLQMIENKGYNLSTEKLKIMNEKKEQIKNTWADYLATKSCTEIQSADASMSERQCNTTNGFAPDANDLDRKKLLETKMTTLLQDFMGYDEQTKTSENFSIIQNELSLNAALWNNQIENVFEVPEESQNAYALMQSGVFKDYLSNREKFILDKKDITRALAASDALIRGNDALFGPLLSKIAPDISSMRADEDDVAARTGVVQVRKNTKDPAIANAQLQIAKDFCLEVIGFHEIPASIKKECGGFVWGQPNSNFQITFNEVVDRDYEDRVCMPTTWKAIERNQINLEMRTGN